MKLLNVPYSQNDVDFAPTNARQEAITIFHGLKEAGAPEKIEDKEIIALIAYLQRLGQDFKKGEIK